MNPVYFKPIIALVPAGALFFGALILSVRLKAEYGLVQLVGAGFLVLVVLTHVCEALHFLPWMHWGLEHSAGHYLDLSSAVLGLTLFPLGYLFHALTTRRS